jgi:hypothetical protein
MMATPAFRPRFAFPQAFVPGAWTPIAAWRLPSGDALGVGQRGSPGRSKLRDQRKEGSKKC